MAEKTTLNTFQSNNFSVKLVSSHIFFLFLIVSCTNKNNHRIHVPVIENPVFLETNPDCNKLESALIPMLFTAKHTEALKYLNKTCKGRAFLKSFIHATDLEISGNSHAATIEYLNFIKIAPDNFLFSPLIRFSRARIITLDAWNDSQLALLESLTADKISLLSPSVNRKQPYFFTAEKLSGNFCFDSLKSRTISSPNTPGFCWKYKNTIKISCKKDVKADLFLTSSGFLFINGNFSKSYFSSEKSDAPGIIRFKMSPGVSTFQFYTVNSSSPVLQTSDSCTITGISTSKQVSIITEDKTVEFFHIAPVCASGNYFECRKTILEHYKNSEFATILLVWSILKDRTVPARFRSRLLSELGINLKNRLWAYRLFPDYFNSTDFIKTPVGCPDCRIQYLKKLISNSNLNLASKELASLLGTSGTDWRIFQPASVLSLRKGDLRRSMEWLRLESQLRSEKNNIAYALYSLKLDEDVITWYKTRTKNHAFDADSIITIAGSYTRVGKFHQALSLLKKFYLRFSSYENYAVKILDLMEYLDQEKEIEEFIYEHLGNYPTHRIIFRMASQKLSDFPIFLRDNSIDIINKYKNISPEETDSFFLMDETITRVFKTGSGYHYVRKLIKVQSVNAVDQYGEITPPDNAEIHMLSVIKPDGSEILPLVTSGKPSISLRNLDINDVIRFEYFIPFQSPGSDVFWGPRFHFSNSSSPVLNSIYTVIFPSDMKITMESTGKIPKLVKDKNGNLSSISFSRHFNPPLASEKRMAKYPDYFPTVRLAGNLSPEIFRKLVNSEDKSPISIDIYNKTKQICKNKKDCTEDLIRWIGEQITSDFSITDPVRTFWNRKGSRAHLFKYMALMAGIETRIVYAVPYRHQISWTSFPDPAIFTIPLVLKNKNLMDLRYIIGDRTFIAPAISGSMYLDPHAPNFTGKIPEIGRSLLKADGKLDCRFKGYCILSTEYIYEGFPAARRIEQFKGYSEKQIKLFIENHTLSRIFPAAVLKSFQFKPLGQTKLKLSWKVQIPFYRRGSGISVRTFHQKLSMAKTFSVHKKRKLPLLAVYTPDLNLNLSIIPPAGYVTESEIITSCESSTGLIKRSLSVNKSGTGQLKIQRSINYTVVDPENWKNFRSFSMCVDSAENQEILFRPISD